MEKEYLPEQDMLPRIHMAREYDTEKIAGLQQKRPVRTAQCYELSLYHSKGSRLYINDTDFDIQAGDLRFNRPGDHLRSENHFCSSTLYFQLGPEDKLYGNEFLDSIPGFIGGCGGFAPMFRQIIHHFNSEMPGSKAAQNALLLELLHGLYTQACAGSGHSEAVSRCIRYMEDHLGEKITLEDLGRLTGYSALHVARLFRAELNRSPHDFLSALRMERARMLLSETDRPIALLAADCGFVSESYFYTYFRRANGISPGEYRRSAHVY